LVTVGSRHQLLGLGEGNPWLQIFVEILHGPPEFLPHFSISVKPTGKIWQNSEPSIEIHKGGHVFPEITSLNFFLQNVGMIPRHISSVAFFVLSQ
jgi:hypothetical protein